MLTLLSPQRIRKEHVDAFDSVTALTLGRLWVQKLTCTKRVLQKSPLTRKRDLLLTGHHALRSAQHQHLCATPWAHQRGIAERTTQHALFALEVITGLVHPAPIIDRYLPREWQGASVGGDGRGWEAGGGGGEEGYAVYYRFESYTCAIMMFRLLNVWWHVCERASSAQALPPTHPPPPPSPPHTQIRGRAHRRCPVSGTTLSYQGS